MLDSDLEDPHWITERAHILGTLSPDASNEVGRAIVALLGATKVSGELQEALILCVERLQLTDLEVRYALSKVLFTLARDFVSRGREGGVTSVAIRMAAVHAKKPEGVAALLEFLKPAHAAPVRQVSLQAIANVSRRGPLLNVPELHDLRRAVEAAANSVCRSDLLSFPPVASLAIASIVAARALSLPLVAPWMAAFRSRPLILRQLEDDLAELTELWPATEPTAVASKRVVATAASRPPQTPRRRPRFHIGQEFTDPTSGHLMRVTDMGTRTIVVVDITQALADGYKEDELDGPPYSVHEMVWSEYDLGAARGEESTWSPEGVRWDYNPIPDPCPALHGHSFDYHEGRGPCDQCGKAPDLTGKCTVCKGTGKVMGDCGDSPNVWRDPCGACKGTGEASAEQPRG